MLETIEVNFPFLCSVDFTRFLPAVSGIKLHLTIFISLSDKKGMIFKLFACYIELMFFIPLRIHKNACSELGTIKLFPHRDPSLIKILRELIRFLVS